jgi:stringent starvation protein B
VANTPVNSRRPYLLRAMHEWITDNGQTPHIVVDAEVEGVGVPRQFVKDGKIILNISRSATQGLRLGNDALTFQARFSGVTSSIAIPIRAVLGIYARETGQGMIFTESDLAPEPTEPPTGPPAGPPARTGGTRASDSKRPKLKVVK